MSFELSDVPQVRGVASCRLFIGAVLECSKCGKSQTIRDDRDGAAQRAMKFMVKHGDGCGNFGNAQAFANGAGGKP